MAPSWPVAWSQAAIDKVIGLSHAVVGLDAVVLHAGLAKDNMTVADVISEREGWRDRTFACCDVRNRRPGLDILIQTLEKYWFT
jgi:hypothetical protein